MGVSETILGFLAEPLGVLLFVVVCAPVTAIISEIVLTFLMEWVRAKDWWPRASPLQKALMMNFGYPDSACTDEMVLMGYSYVINLCTNHLICGFMMLPVVYYGWEGAQAGGQACFVIGALMDVSVDVYDEVRMFIKTFLFEPVGKKLFGGDAADPVQIFVVLGVLHHPLAMTMTCPMVLYYAYLPSFHTIAFALLLAAGICFTTGSYKFTLDTTKTSDWYQFKFIIVIQMVTILYTRGYIWFVHAPALLATFWSDGNMGFFYGGCCAATAMSLFNLIMIYDAVSAAVKWIPRSMAESGTPMHSLQEEDLKMMDPTANPSAFMTPAAFCCGGRAKFKKLLQKGQEQSDLKKGQEQSGFEDLEAEKPFLAVSA